ncbi:hypothetical protein TWF696_003372 [Orbilia brochopaga]|uniref:Uncharacterized protein n=1 Tax=Orbilia brochopaga TaxID=3140254 RepID=A0AAV9TXT6_9PEZI
MRHLIRERKQLQYGWMFITFLTTGISICRGIAIKPATSEYSTESRDLVILGVLELNMGVITTSVPACQIWMVGEPLDKLRYTQPFSFFWPIYQRCRRPFESLIRSILDPSIYIAAGLKEAQRIRRHDRLLKMPYYNSLFGATGVTPTQRDIDQHSKLNLMKLKLRKWCSSKFKRLLNDIRELFGAQSKEDELFDIELRHLDVDPAIIPPPLQTSKESDDDEEKSWSDADDTSSESSDLAEQIDEYLSNRNYNILFPSGETAIQMQFEEALAKHEQAQLGSMEEMTSREQDDSKKGRTADPSIILWSIRTWKEKAHELARAINP